MLVMSRQWLNNPDFMNAMVALKDTIEFKDSLSGTKINHKDNFRKIWKAVEKEFTEAHLLTKVSLVQHCEMENGAIKQDDQGPFFKSDKDCEQFDKTLSEFFDDTFEIIANPLDVKLVDTTDFPFSRRDQEALTPILLVEDEQV